MTGNNQHPPAPDSYALKSGGTAQRLQLAELPYLPARPQSYHPKIGLIGCGGITGEHLTAYKMANYQVVALADLDRRRAENRAAEFELDADIYEASDDLLARDDIQVVDIATHPQPREQLLRSAIAAGKHVLSQKPFVLDLDFGQEICEAAKRQGVKLAVNQNGRWAPYVSWIRQAIAAGWIGDVATVDTMIAWDHTWVKGTPFESIPHLILYDFAIHWFDMLHCYTRGQRPLTVFAQVNQVPQQTIRPPLSAQVAVQFDNCQASLSFRGGSACGPANTTHVTGTAGTIHSAGDGLDNQEVTITTPAGQGSPILTGSWFPGGFNGTMSELLVAIEEDRQPDNSGRDNLASLAICFAAMESAASGQPVQVGSVTRVRDEWVRY